MEQTPIRRRRRGNAENVAPEAVNAAEGGATTSNARPRKRRRRGSVGGFHLKLSAPERKGFIRRWVNDTPGRIASMEELAYTHVTEPGIKSDSPDSRVRRLVGTQANGAPLHAYLMETPLEEYQQGIEEKEELHRVVDEAIRAGRDATGRVQDAYGEGSIRAS